jgi:membrane protease YdiL (CAAX protease family)
VARADEPQRGSWFADHPRAGIPVTIVPFLLLGVLEHRPGHLAGAIMYFIAAGVWALYVTPAVFGLPYGRRSLRRFCEDIHLLPLAPLGRNVLLGLAIAALTLTGMLVATILTRHFVLDWSTLPGLRWVKGLTRGIWEEVFFRGIMLVIFTRLYSVRRAVLWTTLIFALVHVSVFSLEVLVDVASIFFIGLLFAFLVLKTGSLVPGIVFHYTHDVFVNLVQHAPGAHEPSASVLFYAFLWTALAIGAWLTRSVVRRWPGGMAVQDA